MRELALLLRETGVELVFSGLKQQVRRVFERGGLIELLGEAAFFTDKERALQVLSDRYGTEAPAADPPRSPGPDDADTEKTPKGETSMPAQSPQH